MKICGIEFTPIKCELNPFYNINWDLVYKHYLTLPKKEYPIIQLTEDELDWVIIVDYEHNI